MAVLGEAFGRRLAQLPLGGSEGRRRQRSERLRNGKNELEVAFASAARVGRERRARYFESEGLRSDMLRFEERAFVRKAQYMFGWDWGPRLASAGIWQPVWLLEHEARLLDVHVAQRHLENGTVELSFSSSIEGEGTVVHFVGEASDAVADGTSTVVVRPEPW